MLRDLLNGARKVTARVVLLSVPEIWFRLVWIADSCWLLVTLACLFELNVILLSPQRLVDLCDIHHNVLSLRSVVILASGLGLLFLSINFTLFYLLETSW